MSKSMFKKELKCTDNNLVNKELASNALLSRHASIKCYIVMVPALIVVRTSQK